MTGVFDVAQALSGGITDRERAWAFIRDFAAAWDEPLTEDDSTPAAELARAEAALCCTLPSALREVYTLLGAQSGLIAYQDPLLPPAEMFVHQKSGNAGAQGVEDIFVQAIVCQNDDVHPGRVRWITARAHLPRAMIAGQALRGCPIVGLLLTEEPHLNGPWNG
ncbi:hypothetical protein ABZ376_19670 [Streptomyces massasporeus]